MFIKEINDTHYQYHGNSCTIEKEQSVLELINVMIFLF